MESPGLADRPLPGRRELAQAAARHTAFPRRVDVGIVRRRLRGEPRSDLDRHARRAAASEGRGALDAVRRARTRPAGTPRATPTAFGATCEPADKRGWERRFEHSIFIVDGQGNLVDEWPHLDELFSKLPCGRGPHQIKISPYDPQKHVWIIDDQLHIIYKFTYDGKLVSQQGTAGRARTGSEHVRSPDRHRVAARRDVLHHRWLRRDARREVRRERQVHHGLGTGAEGPEEPRTERVQHRPQHRDQRRPPALRRRPRAPADAGVRRERQVPRHVDAAFAALAGQPGHPHGQPLHRPERVHLGRRRADEPDPQVRSERELPVQLGRSGRRRPGGSTVRTASRRISSGTCTSPTASAGRVQKFEPIPGAPAEKLVGQILRTWDTWKRGAN